MARISDLDPALYGGPEVPFDGPVRGTGGVVDTGRQLEPGGNTLNVLDTTQQAQEVRQQQALLQRPVAPVGESVAAAASQFSFVAGFKAVTEASYTPDPNFNFGDAVLQIPFELDETELDFMKSQSAPEFMAKLDKVKQYRQVSQTMGDHPLISATIGMVDPGWLALDAVGLGAAHATRVGKLGAAAIAGAGGAALGAVEATQRPMALREIAAQAALNAAAVAVVFKGKKAVPRDKGQPTSELRKQADVLAGDTPLPPTPDATVARTMLGGTADDFMGPPIPKTPDAPDIPPGVFRNEDGTFYRVVADAVPAKYEDVVLPARAAVTAVVEAPATLPKELAGAKPRYAYKAKQFALKFESDIDKAAYIAAQNIKSAKDGSYLKFVQDATGWAASEVVTHGQKVKAAIKAQAKNADAGEITVAKQADVPNIKQTIEVKPAKPSRTKPKLVAPEVPAVTEPWIPPVRRNVEPAVPFKEAEAPLPGTGGAPPTIAGVATELLERGTPGVASRIASALYWNTHKTLAKWNPRVADLMVDNNSNLGINSVESIHRAVRADLHQMQYVAEDLLSNEMARQGASHWKRIVSPVKSAQIQQRLSANVSAEMWAREQAERLGQQYVSRASKEVQQIADAYEAVAQRAYNEMKDAGVQGMEGVTAKRGWMRRQWNVTAIENMEERLVAKGFTTEKAHQAVVRMVAASLRRANTTLDDITAYDIGATIINRAKRKGYFEDSMFEMHQGNKVLKEVRDELELSGMPQDRIQRVMAVLEGKNNEAGKPGFLKHRMDLDYKQGMIVDGELFRVTDLLDNNIATITERYLDGVSARVAFTKSGLPNATAIDNLKAELLHSTPAAERRGAEELFDNIVASLEGRPAGQAVNDTLRKVQQVTRMVSLGNSGIYQLTEMAVTVARYGMLTSVKHLIKEMPGARKLFNPTPETARSLKNVLTAMSTQDIRLRPYIHKFEDNFHIDPNDATHLRLQAAGQLVPYINAMKYVHGMQAKMTAGVIIDRVNAAIRGEAKAIKAVEKYGINAQVLEKVRSGVSKGGMNVDAWGDDSWDAVRPALAKMMDEAVLRARIGDVPAFAKFNEVGKFIFTFRSFVLGAHNKILAGTLDREGIHGLSLLMLYQYPLSALATQSIKVASGQEPLSTDKLVMATVSNMGAVGLISELAGVISGEKRNFGSPGTLLVDRMYKLAGSTASAIDPESKTTGGDVAAQVASLIPLAGIFYPVKNIAQGLKEGE